VGSNNVSINDTCNGNCCSKHRIMAINVIREYAREFVGTVLIKYDI
jgi:hypothetical protein